MKVIKEDLFHGGYQTDVKPNKYRMVLVAMLGRSHHYKHTVMAGLYSVSIM